MGLRTTVPDPPERGVVELGCSVRVRDAEGEDDDIIVSHAKADAARGRIAETSPVGGAILGRRRGEQVDATTPDGVRRLTILGITPGGYMAGRGGGTPWLP